MKIKLLYCLLLVGLIGCSQPSPYHKGDFVKVRLDGRKGQVVEVYYGVARTTITVRVVSKTDTTNTHILGPDGKIDVSPYSFESFQLFEIEPWKD